MNTIKRLLFIAQLFCFPVLAMDEPHAEQSALTLIILDRPEFNEHCFRQGILDALSTNSTTIRPSYVPLIMTRDPFEGEESDGEDDPEFSHFNFQKAADSVFTGQWNQLPFSMNTKKAGTLENRGYKGLNPKMRLIANKFLDESFGETVEISRQEAPSRVAITALQNRLRSISRSRNYTRERPQLDRENPNAVPIKNVCYHIVPQWLKHGENGTKPTDQEEVARFFRAFKAWEQRQGIDINTDASAARLFRRHYEDNFGPIVPFQSFRNRIKDDAVTINAVNNFYAKNPENPTYLLFFDDDFRTLRPFGVGLLSIYDQFVNYKVKYTGKIPTLLSTGYRFATQPDISLVASEIDRWVRAATAKIIPTGTCYPEPNMAIKTQDTAQNRPIINAQFDEKKNTKSKTESRDFIKAALAHGDITNDTASFLPYGPLPTETPQRVINKSRNVKAERNSRGRIINWDKSALQFLRTLPQSHVESRDWTQGVMAAMKLNDLLHPEDFNLNPATGQLRKNTAFIAASAVCKMYSAYSPVSAALPELISDSTSSFTPGAYGEYLLNYSEHVPRIAKEEVGQATSLAQTYLHAVKKTDSMEHLRPMLKALFSRGSLDVEKIEDAARLAGKTVRDAILYYYDFGDNPAIQAARQETLMYLLEQREPNLISLEATPMDIEQQNEPTISVTVQPAAQEVQPVSAVGQMIHALKLPKKGKKSKLSYKDLATLFEAHGTSNRSEKTTVGYMGKIPTDSNARVTPSIRELSTLIQSNAKNRLIKDFDLSPHDIQEIAAHCPGKMQSLLDHGVDSTSVLESDLTVFGFFQILGIFT